MLQAGCWWMRGCLATGARSLAAGSLAGCLPAWLAPWLPVLPLWTNVRASYEDLELLQHPVVVRMPGNAARHLVNARWSPAPEPESGPTLVGPEPHVASVPAASPAICRHWWRKGACAYGDDCRFAHPPHTTLPPWPRRAYRQQTHNSGRVGIFRRWLVEMFGLEVLRHGSGVLDVAGGHGKLAFELRNVHDIPVTVVDPRPLHLRRCAELWRRGLWHKTNSRVHAGQSPPARRQDEPALMPGHLRLFFEQPLWAEPGVSPESSPPESFFQNLTRSKKVQWGSKGLKGNHERCSNSSAPINIGEETKDESLCANSVKDFAAHDASSTQPLTTEVGLAEAREAWTRAGAILANCSCVVGMHPDQAAGLIVDFALSKGLPFAVVPCCVYGAEFPKRKLRDGRRVTSYEDLLDWIQQRDSGICRTVLPGLEGRNICLYWTGAKRNPKSPSID